MLPVAVTWWGEAPEWPEAVFARLFSALPLTTLTPIALAPDSERRRDRWL